MNVSVLPKLLSPLSLPGMLTKLELELVEIIIDPSMANSVAVKAMLSVKTAKQNTLGIYRCTGRAVCTGFG